MASSKILPVLLLSCTILFLQLHSSAGQNAVKAAYWFSGSEFPVADIDSTLFTHLFCAFADLNSQNFQVTVSSANQPRFSTFTRTVQQKNSAVKTLLSIGGGSASKESFARMASQAASRKSFIDSSINLARSLNFHGLDLDWEYPANAAEMSNFGTLLNEWRSAVNAEARTSGKPALLLTAAVTYSSNYFGVINPTPSISNSLDWVNVMAYDFYYSDDRTGSRITGPPAALFSPDRRQVSGDAGIMAWIQSGLSPKKLVLGFPLFGHSWRLANGNNHGFWAPVSGDVNGGQMSYKQIRQFINGGATKVFNATVVSDYCYSGTTWIGYDDTQSVNTKIKYAKDKGLLGYFAWQISQDDNWILSREASRTWGA